MIRPKTVDWVKIYKTFNPIKERFQKLSQCRLADHFTLERFLLDNCNYAVNYAKDPLLFKITGIGGPDILEGNKTLTLGLVWQIMRAYTLSILQKLAKSSTPIADKDIVNWANEKVCPSISRRYSGSIVAVVLFQLKAANKKTFLNNFQDHSLSDSVLICDLIDAIKPGSIQYGLLKTAGTPEVRSRAHAREQDRDVVLS